MNIRMRISTSTEQGWRKGPWTPEEDKLLVEYVSQHGEGRWSCASKSAGLNRSGKSCRLRWVNYLRPGLKKGHMTPREEGIIIELHALWGNKWSTIARYLPGRTDNEIKNYWRTHFKKRKNTTSTDQNQIQKIRSKSLEQKQQQIINSGEDHVKTSSHHHYAPANQEETTSEYCPDNIDNNHYDQFLMPMDNIDNNHYDQFLMPMILNQEKNVVASNSTTWLDSYIPVDNYLWGGLWNLDDQNGCGKMAIQNNHDHNSSRGGEGYIF